MQIYRVHCGDCGQVPLMARDITVTGAGYRFRCPVCGATVSKAANRRQTELLRAHGAATPPDPAPIHPALTMDDVIAFHELLEDDRNIEAFLSPA